MYAGGAQFSAVGLIAGGAGPGALLAMTVLVNARHVLYGLTLAPRLTAGWRGRLTAAYFLTDEAFGVALALGRASLAFLFGAELTLFGAWNAATLMGALAAGPGMASLRETGTCPSEGAGPPAGSRPHPARAGSHRVA